MIRTKRRSLPLTTDRDAHFLGHADLIGEITPCPAASGPPDASPHEYGLGLLAAVPQAPHQTQEDENGQQSADRAASASGPDPDSRAPESPVTATGARNMGHRTGARDSSGRR